MPLRPTVTTALAALALAGGLCSTPLLAAPAATEPLSIRTATGEHRFTVEVMHTREELERGLMYRKEMAPDHGMLFDFGSPQPVSMWMKNTYLPLDMVFIASDGRVVSVKHDAKPMSEDIIPSGGDVLGVLEVDAGTAAKIGLKPGDRVIDPLFGVAQK